MRLRWPRSVLAMLLAASAGALGALALAAGPALAAPAAGGCGLNPCPPDVNIVGMSSDGTVRVIYTAPDPSGTVYKTNLPLTVTWTPKGTVPLGAPKPPDPPSVTVTNGNCTGTGPVTCDYPFPSALMYMPAATGPSYALNGTYGLSASAQDCAVAAVICSPTTTKTGSVGLATAPTPPTAVTAVLVPKTGVKVSWTPSPEPDVYGYRVLRKDESQACQFLTSQAQSDTSCVDSSSGGGDFLYTVVAYRYGADYSKAPVVSAPSTASNKVTVPGTPVATTTTLPGGSLPPLTTPGFTAKPSPGKFGGGGTGTFRATPGTAATVPAAAGTDTPANGDTGFQPVLPYGQPATTVSPDPGVVAAAPAAPHKGKTSVGTIAVVGAGLLIAVIALHGLWLRSEVRRSGTLEVLEPEV